MAKEKTRLNPRSYLTILPWMVEELGLENTDLLIYAIIYGFCQDGDSDYHGGLKFLMQWTNKTDRAIRNSLNSLVERGLLKKKIVGYNKTTYTAIFPEDAEKSSAQMRKKVPHDAEESSAQVRKKVPHDAEESSANNIYNNKNLYSKDKCEEINNPIKHKYGEFEHVRLSDDDISKLKDAFGDILLAEYVKHLDEYIENTGKSYKNHYLTIRNWIKKDSGKINQISSANKTNQFNNFPQRNNVDFDELEKKLLGGAG